jgi:hypothetical protein
MLAKINWQPSQAELRYFTNTLAIAAIVIGALLALWGKINTALILGGSLLALATLCRFIPPLGRWVYLAWMGLTFVISLIVSPIVIAIIFYVALTPISLLSRLFGKDELRRNRHSEKSTYFVQADNDSSPDSFRRQF